MTPLDSDGARPLDQDELDSFDLLITGSGAHRALWRRLIDSVLIAVIILTCTVVFLISAVIVLGGLVWLALEICTQVIDKWPW